MRPGNAGSFVSRLGGSVTAPVAKLVLKVALIIFPIELGIMIVLSGFSFDPEQLMLAAVDACLLTLIASPIIYYTVAQPFVVSTREAELKLQTALDEQKLQSQNLRCALSRLEEVSRANEELTLSLQSASQDFSATVEEVHRRVGADLHDGPAQLLTYALLRTTSLAENNPSFVELKNVKSVISEALDDVRLISAGLDVPEMRDWQLADLTKNAVERFTDHTGIEVELFVDPIVAAVQAPASVKLCIWRAIQECLSNTYKHAAGQDVRVNVYRGQLLTIEIEDGGPGFDPMAPVDGRLGLKGLRARVASLGGKLAIQSAPGEGTCIRLTLPDKALQRPS